MLLDIARAIIGDGLRALARRVDPGGEFLQRLRDADDGELEEVGAKPVVSPEAAAMIAKPTFKIVQDIRVDGERVAEAVEVFERAAKKSGRRVVAGG